MIKPWNEWDLDALAAHTRLVGFDLDNTLANSKLPMKPQMASRFSELTRRIPVAVITGGRYSLVVSQILDVLEDRAILANLHLMPTSGTRYLRWNGHEWSCVFSHDLDADQRARAAASLERHAREQGLWLEHVWGERIEDRGSQITFSVLGQQAPLEAKQAFDPTGELKERLARAVADDLPDLKVHAGGYTSVDVAGRGIDKAFAIRELAACTGIQVADIVFVGDRMTPGGNDYPAAEAGAMGVAVSCPADTIRFVDGLLERLPEWHPEQPPRQA
ncbi:HAD family hydrolase [Bifidobacterium sp. UTCIF-37]|uniref:phosphomannomutase n=1 Tax=Bifidobacterium callitrichos DSM 23973 TaxID=1437609 RepID=A0A087A9U4_9BIFI|nr:MULTISPECIES: HAD-IIB family hydrolase [Bifidobacterium]KFI55544.1 HAD family hydrolase [Bifidobacterium callitrichos DSM 23973]TPF87210.1 HAD family hydrolase [Bifidobacterium sp. UTCIF-37]TPF91315.1 HAD family hydrolase [Bifidobacterium sp. UTCIF-38]